MKYAGFHISTDVQAHPDQKLIRDPLDSRCQIVEKMVVNRAVSLATVVHP